MEIKAVAIDLDGTLLNSKQEISDYNKEVLKKIRDKGIKVFIATGRLYSSLYKYKKDLNLNSFIIAYNGAMIFDGKTDEKIYEQTLGEELTKNLIKISRLNNIHLNLFQEEDWYIEKLTEEAGVYQRESGLSYKIENFDTMEKPDMAKAMFVGDHEKLLPINEILENKFGNGIYKAFSKPYYLEVLNKNVSKANALSKVLEMENIKKEEVIAFGDGFNDLEMLQMVGVGIAMGNAPENLKNKVGKETKTNDENGVGSFLKEYLGI